MSQSEYGQGARRVSEGCGFWVPHGYGGRQAHILGRGLKEKVIVLYQKVAKLGDHAGAVEFENFPFARRSSTMDFGSRSLSVEETQSTYRLSTPTLENTMRQRKPYKGLIGSLQQTGCMHVLDWYCQGLPRIAKDCQGFICNGHV